MSSKDLESTQVRKEDECNFLNTYQSILRSRIYIWSAVHSKNRDDVLEVFTMTSSITSPATQMPVHSKQLSFTVAAHPHTGTTSLRHHPW